MNKLFLTFLVAIVVTGTALASERTEDGVAVIRRQSTFKVVYHATGARTVTVRIYDVSKKIVFTEKIKNCSSFMRPYNFSSLPEGEYVIEVANGERTTIENVSYRLPAEPKVEVSDVSNSAFRVDISSKELAPLSLKIYDASNNLLHKETISAAASTSRVYKLRNVAGKVLIEVKDHYGRMTTMLR
jgi:hypothetical protein